jgi:hypothetical protein
VGAASQLHASFVILLFASAILVFRRTMRIDWRGALAGAGVVALSFWPWLRAVASGEHGILPGSEGFPLRGLIYLFPLLRGWLYWLRYGSLYLPRDVVRLDFVDLLGARWSSLVARPLELGLAVLTPLTIRLAHLGERAAPAPLRIRLRRRPRGLGPRGWLREYTVVALLAATISFALAPTTVMAWQALIVLHAAVLPLLMVGASALRGLASPRGDRAARRGRLDGRFASDHRDPRLRQPPLPLPRQRA